MAEEGWPCEMRAQRLVALFLAVIEWVCRKGRKSRFGMRAKQLHVTQASEPLIALIGPLFFLRYCEVTQD